MDKEYPACMQALWEQVIYKNHKLKQIIYCKKFNVLYN